MIYHIDFTDDALQDIERLEKSGNKNILEKLSSFYPELKEHPTTGTGHPKPLSGDRAGQWSRRISDKHRLVYEIKEEELIVRVLATWGHYNDK